MRRELADNYDMFSDITDSEAATPAIRDGKLDMVRSYGTVRLDMVRSYGTVSWIWLGHTRR